MLPPDPLPTDAATGRFETGLVNGLSLAVERLRMTAGLMWAIWLCFAVFSGWQPIIPVLFLVSLGVAVSPDLYRVARRLWRSRSQRAA